MVLVKGGYTPDVIVVEWGKPVRLNFVRQESASCSEMVLLPAFNESAKLPEGETVPVEFPPDGARRVRVRLQDGHVPRAVDRGAMRTEAPKSAMCCEERRGRWGATQCRRSARQEGTEMKMRWIPIATMAMGLTLAPAIVGAQMPPGGGMGPGMRGGMGMGDMMQMRGMMQQMQGMMQNMADLLKSGTMSPDQMKRMGELMEQMTAHIGQAHHMMGGMGPGERGPRAMHEQMARMQQHMADMQKHMADMMGSPPSGSPPASPGKK